MFSIPQSGGNSFGRFCGLGIALVVAAGIAFIIWKVWRASREELEWEDQIY